MITEHARGIRRPLEVAQETTAERLVIEAHELLGERREQDYGFITTSVGSDEPGQRDKGETPPAH